MGVRISRDLFGMKRAVLWLLLLGLGALSAKSGPAQDPLGERIDQILASSGLKNAAVGVHVVDLDTGQEIFAHHAGDLLNPASNAKIITGFAALKLLGPEYQFHTSLYGQVDAGSVKGPLYLKGTADPSLDASGLYRLISMLNAKGVIRIEGGIVIDDTYFDEANLPYAYDQQPNDDSSYRAPVGAVSVDGNQIRIFIQPGIKPGDAVSVRSSAPGYPEVENRAVTSATGPDKFSVAAETIHDRTRIRVEGSLSVGHPEAVYSRRIDNPSLFAGYVLKEVLRQSGFTVGETVERGKVPKGTDLLASIESPPLASILFALGKWSNNFTAEMVLKASGAEKKGTPGTWAKAASAVEEVLKGIGIPKGSYVFRNGSGLYDADRFSASQITTVLLDAWRDVTLQPEFLSQLSMAGVDGTLGQRFTAAAVRRHVRAKTGTLSDVSALSGYVLLSQNRGAAFSILVNGAENQVQAARELQDRIVTSIFEMWRKSDGKR